MNGRADIVAESRQRQLRRSGAAADIRIGFQDENLAAHLGQANGGRQAIWTSTDNDRIKLRASVQSEKNTGLNRSDLPAQAHPAESLTSEKPVSTARAK